MKTLRKAKLAAVLGVMAVVAAVMGPSSAQAGCGGYGYGGGYRYATYHAPVKHVHYAPAYRYAPAYVAPTYYAPSYYAPGYYAPW